MQRKEIVNKIKRQPSEWDKIITNETTDKGLISKIYKYLMQLHTRQTTPPKKKWQKIRRTKQMFLQRRHTNGQQHMKKCSTLLIIREMQIKTTMRYHLTPIVMALIKKSTNTKCWRGCGEKGMLLHCWWECKLI